MSTGGWMLFDNTWWNGTLADAEGRNPRLCAPQTQARRRQAHTVALPVGDGLTVRQKSIALGRGAQRTAGHLVGSFLKQDGTVHLQSALVDELLGLHSIGALQPHDDGHIDGTHVLVSIHDTLRHAVATNNAAKNVDQMAFTAGSRKDHAECLFDALCVRRSTNVQEVRGLSAAELDDVHRGHGQSSAVDHAPTLPSSLT